MLSDTGGEYRIRLEGAKACNERRSSPEDRRFLFVLALSMIALCIINFIHLESPPARSGNRCTRRVNHHRHERREPHPWLLTAPRVLRIAQVQDRRREDQVHHGQDKDPFGLDAVEDSIGEPVHQAASDFAFKLGSTVTTRDQVARISTGTSWMRSSR